jgi:hypothetical protein
MAQARKLIIFGAAAVLASGAGAAGPGPAVASEALQEPGQGAANAFTSIPASQSGLDLRFPLNPASPHSHL